MEASGRVWCQQQRGGGRPLRPAAPPDRRGQPPATGLPRKRTRTREADDRNEGGALVIARRGGMLGSRTELAHGPLLPR